MFIDLLNCSSIYWIVHQFIDIVDFEFMYEGFSNMSKLGYFMKLFVDIFLN